ncbi:expressed unknown protein [Ectocarpus siliculosus]|uniref:F-box domain-containing protein n=1 Tax=Ectocarpus siliculosus TaxID=2880 RepID=D8LKJ2_ECTSI|nr:expressed unknown protein [Ectocarpus siliculosus]|eukprot:CBN74582.1 expressed unknown protein [Ectocarpus siliculosus]
MDVLYESQHLVKQLGVLFRNIVYPASTPLLPLYSDRPVATAQPSSSPGHLFHQRRQHHQEEQQQQQALHSSMSDHPPCGSRIQPLSITTKISDRLVSLSNIVCQKSEPLLPLQSSTPSHPCSTFSSFPAATATPVFFRSPYAHHPELVQRQQERHPLFDRPFPLDQLPEDVLPSVLAFLPARELSGMRRASQRFLQEVDHHGDALWRSLCRCEFPSMASSPTAAAGVREDKHSYLSHHHQQYVSNVMHRANDQVLNLRSNRHLRKRLYNYTWGNKDPQKSSRTINMTSGRGDTASVSGRIGSTSGSFPGGSTGGNGGDGSGAVIGLLSDLVTVPDPRIARALSFKCRFVLSRVVVVNDNVSSSIRRSGLYTERVEFLSLSALRQESPSVLPRPPPTVSNDTAAVATASRSGGRRTDNGGGCREEVEAGANLLPLAPETPAPAGFLGYAVRLLQLRPGHESLRWTVLLAVFKDLAVFETSEQAEVVRARMANQRLFYCALDRPRGQGHPSPAALRVLPHISHWGFQQAPGRVGGGGGGRGGGHVVGSTSFGEEDVDDAVERQERIACLASSSLEALKCGRQM